MIPGNLPPFFPEPGRVKLPFIFLKHIAVCHCWQTDRRKIIVKNLLMMKI